MDITSVVATYAIAVAGGFFGATVGGGGLVMIPYMMMLGLPPQVAIASARFGDLGLAVTSSIQFWRSGQIVWKYVPVLTAVSLVGAIIGANILLSVQPEHLRTIAAVILVALLPLVIFRRDVGVVRREVSRLTKALSTCAYFIIQTFTGFFGAGTGPLAYYTLMIGHGLTIIEAVATHMIPFLVLGLASVAVFAAHGLIDYPTGIILLAGTATGGYIGAHVAVRKGARWIKGAFAVMVIAAALKLLFF